ncbi:MAG: hypothetical protein ACREJN_03885 [Nitrospiraceae bacterium]
MSNRHMLLQLFTTICLVMTLGVSGCVEAGLLGFGGDSWKEEVLLHDGSKIVVERTVERGGRHEIGQKPSYKEQSLSFTLPGTNQIITWEDHYSQDLGQANFLPMALDIFGGTPYLVAYPMGCPSYNKWGRPNPPYVVFQNQGKEWTRIPLQKLPAEIMTPNVIFSMPDIQVERFGKRFITAEMITGVINGHKQPEFKTILREPLKQGLGGTGCSIPTTATGKLIAPEVGGEPIYDNWWPLASEWMRNTYGKEK